jgi:acyl-CoA synthetase (AMP-forming)/AMP-acid ligase II
VPDEARGEEVLAIVVPNGAAPDPQQVFAHCARHLARFKVPRYLRVEDKLPKTPSGKIAKAPLRERWRSERAGCFDRIAGRWL